MTEKPPIDSADNAEDFAHRWRDEGSHTAALKAAARTELPISREGRRLCRAMAR